MKLFRNYVALQLVLFALVAHSQEDDIEMDEEEQLELRSSLTWGRFFLDGAVTHHQYFKARFGGATREALAHRAAVGAGRDRGRTPHRRPCRRGTRGRVGHRQQRGPG